MTAATTTEMRELVTQSKEMLKNASTGEWDKVSKGEARRRQLLEKLFSEPVAGQDVNEVDRIIREVLVINEKLESITIAACELAKSNTGSIVSGRRAVEQYAMHAG